MDTKFVQEKSTFHLPAQSKNIENNIVPQSILVIVVSWRHHARIASDPQVSVPAS